MRLIDANALKVQLQREIDRYYNEDSGGIHTAMEALDEIDNAPTVEAEPVRHGRWFVRRYGCSEELVIDCSACNESTFSLMPFEGLVRGFKYCPNCGAKMDGEVEHG